MKSNAEKRRQWDWDVEHPTDYTYKPWPLHNLGLPNEGVWRSMKVAPKDGTIIGLYDDYEIEIRWSDHRI